MKTTQEAALTMIGRLPTYCYLDWCKYKGETYAAQFNLEATMKAGKPMIDLSYCITKALNQCILLTVQFDKSKFSECPSGQRN